MKGVRKEEEESRGTKRFFREGKTFKPSSVWETNNTEVYKI